MAVARLGADRCNLLEQDLLGRVLDRTVERQHEVVTGHGLRGDGLGSGNRASAGRHLTAHLAAGAGQQVVVLQLEPGDPDAVDVGASDDAAPGVAAGHLASALPVDVDPGELHVGHLIADVGVDLPAHEHEPAILGLDLGEQFGHLVV